MHTRRNVLFLIVTVVVSVFIAQPVFASPANDLASLAQEQADLDAELDTIMQDIRKVEDDHKVCEAELAEAQAEVALAAMRSAEHGKDAVMIGRVLEGEGAFIKTRLGATRRFDVLYGEGLPRIC